MKIRQGGARPLAAEAPDARATLILSLLHEEDAVESGRYHRGLVMRQVRRRMGFQHLEDLEDYLQLLDTDAGELEALRRDLAAGVASLSAPARLSKAFIEQVMPELLPTERRGGSIRAWVCRCGTGEAVYSLAMTLCEQFTAERCNPDLRIFATDVDKKALTIARHGVYPTSVTRRLARERLDRFFDRRGKAHYQVTAALRDKIVFAAHDWLNDPPFRGLDLIVSAGSLIGLTAERKRNALERFHFALRDGRFLMLSRGEAAGAALAGELFAPLRPRLHLYRRITPPSRATRQLPRAWPAGRADPRDILRRALADESAAAVLVDGDFTILATHGFTAGYLGSQVECRANLLTFLSRESAESLRAASHQLRHGGTAATEISLSPPAVDSLAVRMRRIKVIGAQPEALIVMSFHEHATKPIDLDAHGELPHMNLAALQRANEELQRSREDLASLNMEYVSVNRELVAKIGELNRASADLASLLDSTNSDLFLDQELRIKRFAPGVAALLHIGPGDVGRSIGDFTSEFRDTTFSEDCSTALQRFETVERPIEALDGRWFSRRVFPYRSTADPQIVGLLVTFTDISESLRARRAVIETEYWRRLVEHLPVGAVLIADGRLHVNQAMEALTGYGRDELPTLQQWFSALFGPRADEMYASYEAQRRRGFPDPNVFTIMRKEGAERTLESWGTQYDGGEIHVLHDVTEKHALQRQVLDLVTKEQRTVGQELHDTVLQDLSALGLLAASLAERLQAGSAERERADRLAAGLGELNVAVQRMAEGLLPLPMEDVDLGAALEALAARTAALHGLSCHVAKSLDIEVDTQNAHELYRIAQEALTNVVKHAAAKTVEIRLEQDSDVTTLQILDDGVGVKPASRGAGLGTRIMQYRCQLIGGRFALDRRARGGTRVVCIVPRAVELEAS
jgi:two-component system CheB/CheR fusion protein